MSPTVYQQPTALLNQSALTTDISKLKEKKIVFKKDAEDSWLDKDGFLDFLDEVRETVEKIVTVPGGNIPILFDKLFKASNGSEKKDQVRYFLNLVFTEINRQNPTVLHEMPLFYVPDDGKDEQEVEEQDKRVFEFLIKDINGLTGLRSFADPLQQNKIEEKTGTGKTEEDSSKEAEKPLDTAYVGGAFRRRGKQANGSVEPVEGFTPETAPSTQGSGSIKDGFRSVSILTGFTSNQVELILLNQFLGPQLSQFQNYQKPWGDTLLPPNIEMEIRSFVLTNLTQHFNEYLDERGNFDQTAFAQWAAQHVLRQYPDVFIQLDQVTQAFYKDSKVESKKNDYKKIITDLETQTTTPEVVAQANESYAKKGEKAFKSELEHILAYSVLSSQESMESLSQKVLDRFPQAYGAGINGLDKYELFVLLDIRSQFSVNIEEQNEILEQLNGYLINIGPGKLQTEAGQAELKAELGEKLKQSLVSIATNNQDVGQTAAEIIQELARSGDTKNLRVDDVKKALDKFPRLTDDNKNVMAAQILTYIQTGKLHLITPQPVTISSAKATLTIQKADSEGSMRKLLMEYSAQNADGMDTNTQEFLIKLNTIALTTLSVKNLDESIKAVIEEKFPGLAQDEEFFMFTKDFVLRTKGFEATDTKNPILTYSPESQEKAPVQEMMDREPFVRTYGTVIMGYAENRNDLNPANADSEEQAYQLRVAGHVRALLREQQQASIAENDQKAFQDQLNADSQNQTTPQETLSEAVEESNPYNYPETGVESNPDTPGPSAEPIGGQPGDIRKRGLNNAAVKMVTSQVKKYAPVVAGTGIAGLGAGALAASLFKGLGTAVSIGAGTAGGAAAGAIIGSSFFGIGALPGAIIGGATGFVGSLIVNSSGGSGAGSSLASSAAGTAKSLTQQAARTATPLVNSGLENATSIGTTAGITIGSQAIVAAVVGTPIFLSIVSILTITTILSAFLPDASSTQVAPYFSLDVNQSRYLTLTKKAAPTNNATPTQITYTVELVKKEDAKEEIVIKSMTDTMAVINKDSNTVDAPALPQDALDHFKSLEGTTLTTTPITFDFTVDATDTRFNNTLVTNSIKISYTQNGTAEDSSSRAFTCFGDCPKITVPPCWPALGHVSQLPRAMGGPITQYSNQLSPGTSSHARFNAVLPNDAYDIGAGSMTNFPPIYAAADGVVIYAGWFKGSTVLEGHADLLLDTGYGNLTIIDHGTFVSYYAHQSAQFVKVGDEVKGGQLIGKVGTTGNSSGNHLHYEVRGFSEYILYQTLKGVPSENTCDKYYGTN